MDGSIDETAPYARGEPTVKVIKHSRERGLPNSVDSDFLERIGVGGGNGYQVMQALKFLGIITDEGRKGRPTELYQRLHRASTEEYPMVLAEILRDAYRPIFSILDPSQASVQQIHDAFRYYKPPGQRGRMVTLFLALMREAQLIPQDDTPRRIGVRKAQGQRRIRKTSSQHKDTSDQSSPESENGDSANGRTSHQQEDKLQRGDNGERGKEESKRDEYDGGDADYRLMFELLERTLPKGERKWSSTRRKTWLNGVEAIVDMFVELVPEE